MLAGNAGDLDGERRLALSSDKLPMGIAEQPRLAVDGEIARERAQHGPRRIAERAAANNERACRFSLAGYI
jgi:hypothetical protein